MLTCNGTDRYTYDALGNRLSETDATSKKTSQYNADNELQATTIYKINSDSSTTYNGKINFTYDADGNITSKNIFNASGASTQKYEYTYDEYGKLTKVKIGSKEITYTYDAKGRLFKRTSATTAKQFHYDGLNILNVSDSSGNTERLNTYLPTGGIYSEDGRVVTFWYE